MLKNQLLKKYIFDFSNEIELNPNLNITLDSNDYLKNFQQFNDLVLSLDKIKYIDTDYEKIFDSTIEILSKKFRKKNEKISFSLSKSDLLKKIISFFFIKFLS